VARQALNEVAAEYVNSGRYGDCDSGLIEAHNNPDALEVLFENGDFIPEDEDEPDYVPGTTLLLKVIDEAKHRVGSAVA
jgi:hypothetical protein